MSPSEYHVKVEMVGGYVRELVRELVTCHCLSAESVADRFRREYPSCQVSIERIDKF